MHPTVRSAVDWIRRRAENVVSSCWGHVRRLHHPDRLSLLLQLPVGWSSELSVITGSTWCCWVRRSGSRTARRSGSTSSPTLSAACTSGHRILVAIATVVLFAMSLPATVKYVTFMKVESSSYLKIRLDILFSIYVVFVVAVIVRYSWSA